MALVTAPLLALAPLRLRAQKVFEKPDLPGLADPIAEKAGEFGAAMDRREELQAERRRRIDERERNERVEAAATLQKRPQQQACEPAS